MKGLNECPINVIVIPAITNYRYGVGAMHWLVGARRKMPCLNYIVASLRCAQCRKYATHICGISFPVWLVVFGVCIPKRDAHIYIYTKRE